MLEITHLGHLATSLIFMLGCFATVSFSKLNSVKQNQINIEKIVYIMLFLGKQFLGNWGFCSG
jgi:hypothetical protein